jgi:hypothetical protein
MDKNSIVITELQKRPETRSVLNQLLASKGFQDRLCSHNESAALIGVSPCTLYCWVSTKRYNLRRVKVGSKNKYWLSDLIRFLNERTVGGDA